MTQYFAYQRFRLWRAPLQTRVLLTLFNVMIAGATAIGIVMWRVRTGLTIHGTRDYFLGNEQVAGPGDEMLFARSLKELLDVTHAHAFEQTFLFFVLCHIFALTRVRDSRKIIVYCASFGSVALDLAAPYLIRFVSPSLAPFQLVSSGLMSLVLLVLLAVPLYEMWIYREPAVEGP
ncbi:MAG TPA: hypothetical protein VHM30_10265 [Gemmatimonadaceae bacterium]|nr:hypothetical protein [Gemmatimonadaceae bacterium]